MLTPDTCPHGPDHTEIPFRYCECGWMSCGSDYHADTGRQRARGNRLVLCTLTRGHDGDHAERERDGSVNVSWPKRKPEPRTWSLPAEPGPEVTAVRCECWPCRLIQPWRRHEDGEWRASKPEPAQHGYAWRWLLHDHGPLTDATGEAQ